MSQARTHLTTDNDAIDCFAVALDGISEQLESITDDRAHAAATYVDAAIKALRRKVRYDGATSTRSVGVAAENGRIPFASCDRSDGS